MNKKQLPLYLLVGCIIPIILFTTVAVAIPYFIKNMDIPTEYDEDTAWGRIFFTNDKISYVPIDSIEYFGNQSKEDFKNQGLKYAADITSLFPDYKARKMTVLSDLGENYAFHIWYDNRSVHYLTGLTYKRGQWIGYISSNDSIQSSQIINLGRVEGNSYSTKEQIIDVSGTYLNGLLILTICILVVCFILYVGNHLNNKWLMWITLVLSGGSIGLLIGNLYGGVRISEAYMIETVIALFCICVFEVVCTLLSFYITLNAPNKYNDHKRNS